MTDAKFYNVPSFTKSGVDYQVIKLSSGDWRCNCPHYVFRDKKCNHIRKMQHLKYRGNNKSSR